MSRGYPSMTALLGLLAITGSAAGVPVPVASLVEGPRELVDRFKQSGQGATADSWVGTGPNQQIAPPKLEEAIGPDVLDTLSKQTGLSRKNCLQGCPENYRTPSTSTHRGDGSPRRPSCPNLLTSRP